MREKEQISVIDTLCCRIYRLKRLKGGDHVKLEHIAISLSQPRSRNVIYLILVFVTVLNWLGLALLLTCP